jgi:ATP-binding protein involved in chromosome partitioning
VKVISIGMFVEGSTAVSWRGPMLHRTIQQFLTDVYFGDLDVLLLDLPPGTGDVAISVGQLLPHAEVHRRDDTPDRRRGGRGTQRAWSPGRPARRSSASSRTWPASCSRGRHACSSSSAPAAAMRSPAGSTFRCSARVPLSVPLRAGGDEGVPVVLSTPTDAAAHAIAGLAEHLLARGRGLAGRSLGLSPN